MDDQRDRTLWCGNLDPRVTESLLYELFIQAGPLEGVTIPKDIGGRPRSYAFVTFKHPESVGYTLALMDGIALYGRTLKLERRPEAAVDDTYIAMMVRHAQHVAEIKRRRFQEMYSPVPSPFMSQWISHPPQSNYDQRRCYQNVAGHSVADRKYNGQYYCGRHASPMPSPRDHYSKRIAVTSGYSTRRRCEERYHEERYHEAGHRRRHTHDPYWRGRR